MHLKNYFRRNKILRDFFRTKTENLEQLFRCILSLRYKVIFLKSTPNIFSKEADLPRSILLFIQSIILSKGLFIPRVPISSKKL
jgi:hypothetical protein